MRNLVISADKIVDLSICPRLYYFKHILRRIPPIRPKYFLEGEFLHSILEYYYNDIIKKRKQAPEFYIEIARNKAASFDGLTIDESEELIKVLKDYLNFYTNEGNWEPISTETPFAKVLLEDEKLDLRVIVRGKSDLNILNHLAPGQAFLTIVDHKVMSRNDPIYSRVNQNLCYVWAFDCRDFIINTIGKQRTLPAEKKFHRDPFTYSEHQIEEWKESVIYSIFDLLKYFETNYYPARFTGCTTKYNQKCNYYDVCETTQDNWQYKLEGFITREDIDIMEDKESE